MNKSDFYYNLPQVLIAQSPVYPRDSSRLLVYGREKQQISDNRFYELADYLCAGDLLVINNTRVVPARIYGTKSSGATVEFLLYERAELNQWYAMARPAKRAKEGDIFDFGGILKGEVCTCGKDGNRIVRFYDYQGTFEEILEKIGDMPLPHYIKERLEDKERYQTIYAQHNGSCAAPTAGLHFTKELIDKLIGKGVEFAEVLLHVGLGTFLPVKCEEVEKHKMHREYYCIDDNNSQKINNAIKSKRRIIAVGTTSVRVLETAAGENGLIKAQRGYTDIFIYPPYKFKTVSALITNFHLPESTLIMLVSAFIGNREKTLDIYKYAVEKQYRFFSFGDAMFIK